MAVAPLLHEVDDGFGLRELLSRPILISSESESQMMPDVKLSV
jgi:hypothetical protein